MLTRLEYEVTSILRWLSQSIDNTMRNAFHHRHHHGITKLPVGLGIRYRNLEVAGIAHEKTTFARCQATRIPASPLINKYFRSILVIPGTQRSGDILPAKQAKTESVSSRLVLFCIVLEILPQMIGKRVLLGDILLENGVKRGIDFRQIRKLEVVRISKSHNEDPLAVLWDNLACIDNLIIHMITELFSQGAVNDIECIAAIMALEVFDILKDEGPGSMKVDYSSETEKQVSLFDILKTMLASKTQLLGNTRNAEGLAWKSGT